MIKPGAFANAGKIVHAIQKSGFIIANVKMAHLTVRVGEHRVSSAISELALTPLSPISRWVRRAPSTASTRENRSLSEHPSSPSVSAQLPLPAHKVPFYLCDDRETIIARTRHRPVTSPHPPPDEQAACTVRDERARDRIRASGRRGCAAVADAPRPHRLGAGARRGPR